MIRFGIAVSRRPAFEHVGDVDIFAALQVDAGQHAVEQLFATGPWHGVGLSVEVNDGGRRLVGSRHGAISPFDN
jgi:hypothetical protein